MYRLYSENAPINIDLKAKGKAIQKYLSPLEAVRKEFGNCPKHNLKGFTKCNYDIFASNFFVISLKYFLQVHFFHRVSFYNSNIFVF